MADKNFPTKKDIDKTYTDDVYDLFQNFPRNHHFWGNPNIFNVRAEESPRRRIERIYGQESKNPDFFDQNLVPSMAVDERTRIPVYTHDLGLSRKNFIEFLPYVRRRIATAGPIPLRRLDQTDIFQNINYGENWESAMKYRPMETHPTITGLVSDIKNYDVPIGRNRREDLDDWARLFRDKGYGRIARDLQSHTAEPTMQPLVNQRINLLDDDDEVGGRGYKITNHTKEKARKLGVEVKPSQLGKKKIDVYRGGRKVASVGHTDYCDYPTYRECCGTKMANARREAYKTRHEKTRHKEGTPSFFADKLLW